MLYRAACQQTTQYSEVFAGDREHVRIHRGSIVSEPSHRTVASVVHFGERMTSPKTENCTSTADDRYMALFLGRII